MIEETKQDRAIAYLLGELTPDQVQSLEAEMQANSELGQLVNELREVTATLALALPQLTPPPHLRAKIMSVARNGSAKSNESDDKIVRFGWVTPFLGALAACLALALGYSFYQNQLAQTELTNEKSETANLSHELENLNQQINSLQLATDNQLKQIANLQKQDSLAQMEIATLSAQVETYQKASVVVVWDDQKQQGIIKMVNLPKPAAGKDYQLWIIDPRYPNPVNGGILAINDETATLDSFKPDQLVTSATAFAISVEKTGGVPKAEGPIVFVGK